MSEAAHTLMIQGTASSVGKSLLVAGLCRLFRQAGVRVAPFKAQNMSNNAAVTPDGGEIGRAQAVQAEAAGIVPTVDLNPVLLKPEADHRSQVVVRGRPAFHLQGADFLTRKAALWGEVAASLDGLRAAYELVLIEGAGSPAEINLRAGDIVNMRVAHYADAPVLLAGDIDRGGVFAHLYGTLALLEEEDRARVRGFVINKFRGSIELLQPGLRMIEERAGVPVLAVVPYLHDLRIADEDAVSVEGHRPAGTGALDVAVVKLPRIANFDDIDSLEAEPDVRVRYITSGDELGTPALVVIPGTKATVPDLCWLWNQGLAQAITGYARAGGAVLGLCGGYQMLGRAVHDPAGVESTPGSQTGLGLLDSETTLTTVKSTYVATGTVRPLDGMLAGAGAVPFRGYEIHAGETLRSGCQPVVIERRGDRSIDREDGGVSADGWVVGTYIHGFLDGDEVRRRVLANVARRAGLLYRPGRSIDREAEYDRLAEALRQSFDVPRLFALVGLERP